LNSEIKKINVMVTDEDKTELDQLERLYQYLYDGIEELYKPISLNTVTNDTFKTCMCGGGIKVEFRSEEN